MRLTRVNNVFKLGIVCGLLSFILVSSDDGIEERSILSQHVDLKRFLRSYDYVDNYENMSKKISHDVLAYITPWNPRGYKKATLFAKKFTILSPVWFQLKPTNCEIDGLHNIDKEWFDGVKSVNNKIKFAPRVIFEQWGAGDYQKLFSNGENRMNCIRSLRNLCKKNNFDGLTLEIWMQHFGTSQQILVDFLIEFAKGLHVDGKVIVLPIPPSFYKGNHEGRFGKAHFDLLVKHVDYFSLMTYDYSNPYSPGANAPINWLVQCISNLVPDTKDTERRSKILAGINFYGYDYVPVKKNGRSVVGHDVIDVAKKYSPEFKWHNDAAEHSLEYSDGENLKHSLYFPSVYSIARRVAMVEELGVGVSIWEIGQGFDSFFEQI